MNKVSTIILTKNEEEMIKDCLERLKWCDEIIVIDDFSTDQTVRILEQLQNSGQAQLKIYQRHLDNDFANQRNFGLEKSMGEWILYIDADERVTPELRDEIKKVVGNNNSNVVVYKLKRKNFYLGNHEWPQIERMEKLFKKENLVGWSGELHETPIVNGKVGELNGFLLHYTHRNLRLMLEKTIEWSKIEADLRFKTNHPKMVLWRFPKIIAKTFIDYYFIQGGWKVGTAGLVESIYQSFSIFITYARLWEMQRKNEELH